MSGLNRKFFDSVFPIKIYELTGDSSAELVAAFTNKEKAKTFVVGQRYLEPEKRYVMKEPGGWFSDPLRSAEERLWADIWKEPEE